MYNFQNSSAIFLEFCTIPLEKNDYRPNIHFCNNGRWKMSKQAGRWMARLVNDQFFSSKIVQNSWKIILFPAFVKFYCHFYQEPRLNKLASGWKSAKEKCICIQTYTRFICILILTDVSENLQHKVFRCIFHVHSQFSQNNELFRVKCANHSFNDEVSLVHGKGYVCHGRYISISFFDFNFFFVAFFTHSN